MQFFSARKKHHKHFFSDGGRNKNLGNDGPMISCHFEIIGTDAQLDTVLVRLGTTQEQITNARNAEIKNWIDEMRGR